MARVMFRVETVPDPTIQQPTDALVRVVWSCICGSGLWPYASLAHSKALKALITT
jgi:threonine dehydrogenase-like Zn-dependent dehydrogenase